MMTIAKAERYLKLKKWSTVQDELLHQFKQGDPRTPFSIPFGPQHEHTLKHPNPIRCMTNFHTTLGDVFVTHHGKGGANQVNAWSIVKPSEEIKLQKLKNESHVNMQELLFIPCHRIFVAFCPDMTLRVFSDIIHNFHEMYQTRVSRTVLCMAYNKETDQVFTGGQGFLQRWNMVIKEMHVELESCNKFTILLSANEWVVEIKIDHRNKQLLILCDNGVHILDYETNEQKHYLRNRHDTSLTCCTFFSKRDYFITASKDGSIKVWNMVLFTQVHDFRGHYEPVTSMQVHPPKIMLISGSMDGTIRLWSLETFELFFRLDVLEPVHKLTFMNTEEMFYHTQYEIKILKLNLFSNLFSIVQSRVQKLSRTSWDGYPSRILASAMDGGVRILSPATGALITIIYPMNTTEVWTNYVYDRESNKIYVVLKCGEVMVFDCGTNPCIAGQILEPHSHDEEVLSIALIRLNKSLDDEQVSETLVFAGLKDGMIMLLNAELSNMEKSVQGHAGKVTVLESSIGDGGDNEIGRCDRLVSAGTDNQIKIWSVGLRSPQGGAISITLMKSIVCDDFPKMVTMVGSMVFATMTETSVLTAYDLDADDQKVKVISHSKEDDHADDVTGLDVCQKLRIVATTGLDGMVKIWDYNNELIQEMEFNSTLKGVCFANERGDLLVGLQNHVFSIPIANYLPWSCLEKMLVENFDDDIIELPIGFADTKQINLDVNMVPVYPSNLQKRREIMIEEYEERLRQMPRNYEPLPLETEGVTLKVEETKLIDAPSRIRSPQTAQIPIIKTPMKKQTKKARPESVDASPEADDADEPITEEAIEVQVEGEPGGEGQGDSTKQTTDGDAETEENKNEETINKRRLPVAPDGYIPNSVVRKLYKIEPPEIVYKDNFKLQRLPKLNPDHLPYGSKLVDSYEDPTDPDYIEKHQDLDARKHRLQKRQSKQKLYNPRVFKHRRTILMLSLLGQDMDGVARQLTGEVKPFLWHEGEKEVIDPEVPKKEVEVEDLKVTKAEKIPKRKITRGERNVGLEQKSGPPQKPEKKGRKGKKKFKGGGLIEEDEEEEGDLYELLRRIKAEGWMPDGTDITPENALETLMRLLNGASTPIRRSVMKYIGEFYRAFGLDDDKKEAIVSKLQELLQCDDVHIRVGSVKLLGELGLARRDIILGLLPNLIHGEPELREETAVALRRLTGIFNKDDLVAYLGNLGVIKSSTSADQDGALKILEGNVRAKADDEDAKLNGLSVPMEPPLNTPNSYIDNWLQGGDDSHQDDLDDPLARASHSNMCGQPLSRTTSFGSYGTSNGDQMGLANWGDGRGKKVGGKARKGRRTIGANEFDSAGGANGGAGMKSTTASPRDPFIQDKSSNSLKATRRILGPLTSAESRKRSAFVHNKNTKLATASPRDPFIQEKSSDSLKATRRILGPLTSADSRKRSAFVHNKNTNYRYADSKASDTMSLDGSTTATSMSGAGYSGTYDYSAQKQKHRKESLSRLAESYRQKSQELHGFSKRKTQNSAESLASERDARDGSTTATSMSGAGCSGTYDYSAQKQKHRKESLSRLAESYRQKSQELHGFSNRKTHNSAESLASGRDARSDQKLSDQHLTDGDSDIHSASYALGSQLLDDGIHSASYGLGSQLLDDGSQRTGQAGTGLKSDDSGIGQFSDYDSNLENYGLSLIERGMPHLSPVRDASDFEQGEPGWRRLFDFPQTAMGVEHLTQKRLAQQDQFTDRTKDGINARHTIDFPPISYIRANQKLLPGEAGQRLLQSVHVKAGGRSPDGKWYRVDAMPGRLGVHTSTEGTGTSKFGILKMKWTTEMPVYDPYARQRFYNIPEALPKLDKVSSVRNIPIARPTSPNTKLTTLPHLEVEMSRSKYEWDRPIAPPPPRRSRMDLPIIKTEHDRYCQYYKIAKQKEEQQKLGKVTLPIIRTSQAESLTSEKISACQSPPELELPPITVKMILAAE